MKHITFLKNKKYAALLAAVLALTLLLAGTLLAVSADEAAAVTYIDEFGELKSTEGYTEISEATTQMSNGWYVATGNVTIPNRVTITGRVYLILSDGATLTINGGIALTESNALSIYAQQEGSGILIADASGRTGDAGIGGSKGTTGANGGSQGVSGHAGGAGANAGWLSLCGGSVTAIGGTDAVDIGGGSGGTGGTGGGGMWGGLYGTTVAAGNGGTGGTGGHGGAVSIYGSAAITGSIGGGLGGSGGQGGMGINVSNGSKGADGGTGVGAMVLLYDDTAAPSINDGAMVLSLSASGNGRISAAISADRTIMLLALPDVGYHLSAYENSGTDTLVIARDQASFAVGDYQLTACFEQGDPCAHEAYDAQGFCLACDAYQVPSEEDGIYKIGNAANLLWFSDHVNSGNREANAVLTADIDMSGITYYTPIGNVGSFSYSSATLPDNGYLGTFDGQGHVIKNLTTNSQSTFVTSGVFGTVGGTIKRLGVENYYYKKEVAEVDGRYGAVVGQIAPGGTVANCYVLNSAVDAGSAIGGVVAGCNYGGTIKSCFTYGCTVAGNEERKGWIVGDNQNDGTGSAKLSGRVEFCYTDGSCTTGKQSGSVSVVGTDIDAVAFASGKIAVLMNDYQCLETSVWRQSIGTDPFPNYTSQIVYFTNCYACDGMTYIGTRYTNNSAEAGQEVEPHSFSFDCDEICDVCAQQVVQYTDDVHTMTYVQNEVTHTYLCSVCEKTGEVTCASVDTHDDCTREEVCVCGAVTKEAAEHDFTSGTVYKTEAETHSKQCANCSIYDESEEHFGGSADCDTKAICEACGETYGDVYHSGTADRLISNGNGTHSIVYSCCETVATPDVPCTAANADDTCLTEETCLCGAVLKAAASAHDFSGAYLTDSEWHWHRCNHCSQEEAKQRHSGGTASCTESATCEICQTRYGESLAHSYTVPQNDTTHHWNKCASCDATSEKQAHIYDGGLCTVCEHQPVKSGLPTGAVIGISVGGAVLIGVIIFALIWFVIKKKSWTDLTGIFRR